MAAPCPASSIACRRQGKRFPPPRGMVSSGGPWHAQGVAARPERGPAVDGHCIDNQRGTEAGSGTRRGVGGRAFGRGNGRRRREPGRSGHRACAAAQTVREGPSDGRRQMRSNCARSTIPGTDAFPSIGRVPAGSALRMAGVTQSTLPTAMRYVNILPMGGAISEFQHSDGFYHSLTANNRDYGGGNVAVSFGGMRSFRPGHLHG